jgi:hypothetical protein
MVQKLKYYATITLINNNETIIEVDNEINNKLPLEVQEYYYGKKLTIELSKKNIENVEYLLKTKPICKDELIQISKFMMRFNKVSLTELIINKLNPSNEELHELFKFAVYDSAFDNVKFINEIRQFDLLEEYTIRPIKYVGKSNTSMHNWFINQGIELSFTILGVKSYIFGPKTRHRLTIND